MVSKASNGVSDKIASIPAIPAQPLVTGGIRPLGTKTQMAQKPSAVRVVQRTQPARQVVSTPKPKAAAPATKQVAKAIGTPAMVVNLQGMGQAFIPSENENPLPKHPSLMKKSELAERNKRISERQLKRRQQQADPSRIPTPTAEQANAIVGAQVQMRNAMATGCFANGIPLAPMVNKIIAQKTAQGDTDE
jgi:hypothetical protein